MTPWRPRSWRSAAAISEHCRGRRCLYRTDSSIVTVSTPTSRDLAEQRRAIALMSTTHCLRSGELLISSLRLSGDGHCVRSIDRVRSTTQQHDRARDGRARFRQPSCPVFAEQRRLKSRAQPTMTGPRSLLRPGPVPRQDDVCQECGHNFETPRVPRLVCVRITIWK